MTYPHSIELVEEWRSIPGWPRYEISDYGHVRNRETGLVLRPWKLKNGRWQVHLAANGSRQAYHTYVLVALAFIGPRPFPKAQAAHRDDDKDHNHKSNIRWCSAAENYADRDHNGKTAKGDRHGARLHPHRMARGERQGSAKLKEKDVIAILMAPPGNARLAAEYGVSKTTISYIKARKIWRHVRTA